MYSTKFTFNNLIFTALGVAIGVLGIYSTITSSFLSALIYVCSGYIYYLIYVCINKPVSSKRIVDLIELTEIAGYPYSIWLLKSELKNNPNITFKEFFALENLVKNSIKQERKQSEIDVKRQSDANHQKIIAFIAKELP